MRLGLLLTPQGVEGAPPRGIVEECAALTRAARDAGFSTVLVSHHVLSAPYPMLQPMPLLARLAGEAGEMFLGTGVLLLTLLNPVDVAEHVVTLDAVTGGRVILGVGLGYRPEERAAFGIVHRPARVMLDKLRVVRRLLDGEVVSAEGPGYRLDSARLALRPLVRPPIWMAANTDVGVRRAARNGDAWLVNPHARLDDVARQLDLLAQVRGGRPYRVPVVREVCLAPTDAEARTLAERFLGPKYATYVSWGQSEAMPPGDTLDRGFDELAHDRFIVGGPETAARAVADLRERCGATDLIARVTWPGLPLIDAMRTVHLLAEALGAP